MDEAGWRAVEGDGTEVEITLTFAVLGRTAARLVSAICQQMTVDGRLEAQVYCQRPERLVVRLNAVPCEQSEANVSS